MTTLEADRVELVHEGGGQDGYRTYLVVDDETFYERLPGMHEREISLRASVGELTLWVTTPEGSEVLVIPKKFKLNMGCLKVETRADRNLCAIYVNGSEVRARELSIKFAEGEVPWVNLVFGTW